MLKVFNFIVDINRVIDNSCLNNQNNADNYNTEYDACFANDAAEHIQKLIDKNAHMQDVGDESLKKRYLNSLVQAKQLKNTTNTNSNSIIDTAKSLSLSDGMVRYGAVALRYGTTQYDSDADRIRYVELL